MEQLNYCPEVVEKIWDTVARGRKPRSSPLLMTSLYFPVIIEKRRDLTQFYDKSPYTNTEKIQKSNVKTKKLQKLRYHNDRRRT